MFRATNLIVSTHQSQTENLPYIVVANSDFFSYDGVMVQFNEQINFLINLNCGNSHVNSCVQIEAITNILEITVDFTFGAKMKKHRFSTLYFIG